MYLPLSKILYQFYFLAVDLVEDTVVVEEVVENTIVEEDMADTAVHGYTEVRDMK